MSFISFIHDDEIDILYKMSRPLGRKEWLSKKGFKLLVLFDGLTQ
jgi:hypothetical protein